MAKKEIKLQNGKVFSNRLKMNSKIIENLERLGYEFTNTAPTTLTEFFRGLSIPPISTVYLVRDSQELFLQQNNFLFKNSDLYNKDVEQYKIKLKKSISTEDYGEYGLTEINICNQLQDTDWLLCNSMGFPVSYEVKLTGSSADPMVMGKDETGKVVEKIKLSKYLKSIKTMDELIDTETSEAIRNYEQHKNFLADPKNKELRITYLSDLQRNQILKEELQFIESILLYISSNVPDKLELGSLPNVNKIAVWYGAKLPDLREFNITELVLNSHGRPVEEYTNEIASKIKFENIEKLGFEYYKQSMALETVAAITNKFKKLKTIEFTAHDGIGSEDLGRLTLFETVENISIQKYTSVEFPSLPPSLKQLTLGFDGMLKYQMAKLVLQLISKDGGFVIDSVTSEINLSFDSSKLIGIPLNELFESIDQFRKNLN